jgi:hypothetical protein
MDIDTITVGDMVVLPEGEHGRVSRIDLDEHIVYVDVALPTGIDTVDMDPADLSPRT